MALFIKHDRNNFQVVVKVHSFLLFGEILNELASGNISLEVPDVLLYDFWLVGDGEVEGIVSQSELKQFQFIGKSETICQCSVNCFDETIVPCCPENYCAWSLN